MNTLQNIQNFIINFFFEIEEETIEDLPQLPLVIENIIETYTTQLKYQDVLDEFKEKIKWKMYRYGSQQSILTKSNGKKVSYVWNYSINGWLDDWCDEYEMSIYNDFYGDDTIVQYIGKVW